MRKLTRIENSPYKKAYCRVCETQGASILYEYLYNKETYDILECIECRHIYIDPVPLISEESRTMDTLEDAEFGGSKVLKFLHEQIIIKREIWNVKRIIKKSSPELLDIGCGTGWTTSIWQKHGFQVTGLEPSHSRCEFGKKNYDVNIINGNMSDLDDGKKYDVIVIRHVLEHIKEPKEFLSELRGHLKDGGLLLITIPNINCVGRYLFKENWEWVLPWHLHFYYPKTLKTLVENTGFNSVKSYQTPSPLWYPGSLGRYFGEDSAINRFLSRYARLSTLLLVSPIVLAGFALGMNDNMTLFATRD